MEDIENIQLPETAQSQDEGSESVVHEDLVNNSDFLLASESPTTSLNDKTDDEKLVQNTDNLLNVNLSSPKTTLLGKLKAKQRLQAFLLPKQTPFLNSPTKKIEDIAVKNDKNIKKAKQSPMEKAKSIIKELEEIKKVEIQKIISPTLFKERKINFRDKHYRKKSRSKSLEPVRKIPEKGRYPDNWDDIKRRQLNLEDVYEINKLNKLSRNSKIHDTCQDFRKQLLFELPAQPLVPLKLKGINGQEKAVPSQFIRYTKKSPTVSYSVSHYQYNDNYLVPAEIYDFIPKSHTDILKKLKSDKKQRLADEESHKKAARKWFPKQPLNNITEGCELLEKSLGLSILQNYMDEEEEDEDKYEQQDVSVLHQGHEIIEEVEVKEQSLIEDESNVEMQMSVTSVDLKDNEDKLIPKQEIDKIETENEKRQIEITSKLKKSKDKKNRKHKKNKKEKKESRKRKRKKEKQELKEGKKHKVKSVKSEKKMGNSDPKKENKSKKKEGGKSDKKADGEDKKKHKKEMKRDVEMKSDEKVENKLEIKKDIQEEDCRKEIKWKAKELKDELRKTDKKEHKQAEDKKDRKHASKKVKTNKRATPEVTTVQLYYDEFESIRCSSPSEKIDNVKKEKSRDSSRESKKKDKVKKEESKPPPKPNKKSPNIDKNDEKTKKCEKFKDENIFKIEPLKPEDELGTPDTEEYHSHWESDEDVANVISYSPLPQKLDTSWESDEDILRGDKIESQDIRYPEQELPRKSSDRSTERRSKKFQEGERSLEMPLNIVNLSRTDSRRLEFPERKFLNTDMRLLYNEDSWERGEYLKIFNDIEGEKLRNERKTLGEERRLLELEKRKLAEKLVKRSFNCNIFDDYKDNIVKEVTYEKIHAGSEDIYLKSTDYISEKRPKKKHEHESRKRTHSTEEHRNTSRYEEDHKKYKQSESKKGRYENKVENYDVKSENYKDFVKIENTADYDRFEKKETNKKSDVKEPAPKRRSNDWKKIGKSESEYKIEIDRNDSLLPSDISESLNSTCESLGTKVTNRSDFLENEYEEFLKVVTSEIPGSQEVSKEKDISISKKQSVEKRKKPKRRRKYSTSSSSSSSDSDDSDSSTTSSSSSSDTSSSSSASSYERKKRRRKVKAKQKQKLKQKKRKDKPEIEKIVKIEMTHSIVKDLDDLQPFPIAKAPIIQIKEEFEDPGYSMIPTGVPPVVKEIEIPVPLPVPSPAIVPPPLLNVLLIKQEKLDTNSVTNKADSTTSIPIKTPLIPTHFLSPVLRMETTVTSASYSTSIVDEVQKKDDSVNESLKDVTEPQSVKNSPVFFSISNKRAIFNESLNDNDSSQDFTDSIVKKPEKGKEIPSEELNIPVELAKTETIEENHEEIKKEETIVLDTRFASPIPNSKIELKIPSPIRQPSPIYQKGSSPKRRRHSISPRDKRSSISDSGRRSPKRSISPKYRNASPRRRSPLRRNLRYRDGPEVKRPPSPRRRNSLERYDRRRKSPSPRSRRSQPLRGRRSISPKNRRSPMSRGNRRSPSPRNRRSVSPRNHTSPFRNRSPNRRSPLSPKSRRRSYSRSVSIERKKEPIQQTLQRLAGVDDRYYQSAPKSPINSPVESFKRSVADSTISDDQLLQQNSTESTDSPAYRTPSARLVHVPPSPKRVPLDVRINQVLGLDKGSPKPISTTYGQNYNYEQYPDQYSQYQQYGQAARSRENYVQSPLPKAQNQMGSSKVVQIGNVLQVVPTEDIPPPAEIPKPPTQKIVQVGNMLQIVPTPQASYPPKETIVPPPVAILSNLVQSEISLSVLQTTLAAIKPPPPPLPVERTTPTLPTHEKVSPEDLMLQKIAERRAERAKRHDEREKKRVEKEKRQKEKEKKKQLRLKLKTENMIKKALRIETEALAMGESVEDNEDGATDSTPGCWPFMSVVSNTPLKPAGRGILITHGFSKLNMEDESEKKLKCVKFADGVAPGEGTSPSGGEELSSPPPPKEKRFKKIKKKRIQKKKKIKVKIIRKSSADSPDDEELDNLPPPSPPPGSPPPHIFPARIKAHTINNIHPSYTTGVPLVAVGNYPPQYRPNISMNVPPPMLNVPPHGGHHAPRNSNPGLPQHGTSMHIGISHGLPRGMPSHLHGPSHHPSGPL